MPTVCLKTRPSKTTNMLSIKNSSMLMTSVSENILIESEWFFFLQNMIYPFLPQCICIYVDHYFSYETQLLAKKYGQQISNSQVQTMIAKETNINNVVWKYVILFIVFIMRDYDSVFFTREMLTQLYGRLGIVLNRGKLLYCRIITLRGDA